jgi:RND family efflux transporter MFP subunit
MQRLYEKQAVALADLDRARAAFEVAQAELKRVNQELDESVLRAPFPGRVAATLADRYQLVQARQPILVLHDISSFDIQIYLPETFILEVGREAEVRATAAFDHLPGRAFPVTFANVATEAAPETLTYAVSFTLAAPEDQPLLPGMSVSIRLEVVEPPPREGVACWIPAAAVFSADGETPAVWVVEPEEMRASHTAVKTGILREGQIQILEGLRPGDQVALSGLHSLRERQQVKPYGKKNDE